MSLTIVDDRVDTKRRTKAFRMASGPPEHLCRRWRGGTVTRGRQGREGCRHARHAPPVLRFPIDWPLTSAAAGRSQKSTIAGMNRQPDSSKKVRQNLCKEKRTKFDKAASASSFARLKQNCQKGDKTVGFRKLTVEADRFDGGWGLELDFLSILSLTPSAMRAEEAFDGTPRNNRRQS